MIRQVRERAPESGREGERVLLDAVLLPEGAARPQHRLAHRRGEKQTPDSNPEPNSEETNDENHESSPEVNSEENSVENFESNPEENTESIREASIGAVFCAHSAATHRWHKYHIHKINNKLVRLPTVSARVFPK